MSKQIVSIATLVNENAIDDLKLLLFTLELWDENAPTVYILCDTKSDSIIKTIKYKGKIITKVALDLYTGLSRAQMEQMPSRTYTNLFGDFTAEKTFLMEWAIADARTGVLFCDADICHLACLPEIPENTKLALSPHFIREYDAKRYGYYNAGYLYIDTVEVATEWRNLCKKSRFFEQACLEDLFKYTQEKYGKEAVYEFPIQVNYGWWRLWQGLAPSDELQKEWTFFRKDDSNSGILVRGQPLQSVHTHFYEKKDIATIRYNKFVLDMLSKLVSMKNTKALVQFIKQN